MTETSKTGLTTWLMLVLGIVFMPIGIVWGTVVMWRRSKFNVAVRVGLTVAAPVALFVLVAPDVEQTAALLTALEGKRLHLTVLIAVTMGLRRGEVLGLRFGDVDLEARTLTVSRSLCKTKESGVIVMEPKTKRSRRTIVLPSALVEVLLDLKRTTDPAPGDYVVSGRKVDFWGPEQFSSEYCRTVKELGFPYRLHDMRHAHASQLLALGVQSPKSRLAWGTPMRRPPSGSTLTRYLVRMGQRSTC